MTRTPIVIEKLAFSPKKAIKDWWGYTSGKYLKNSQRALDNSHIGKVEILSNGKVKFPSEADEARAMFNASKRHQATKKRTKTYQRATAGTVGVLGVGGTGVAVAGNRKQKED